MNKEQVFTTKWLGRTLTIKTGKLALQANSAVTVQYGETVVLATVVESKTEREGIDFFPLMVDFEEKLYAAGIIKGSRWIKREGRPTDDSVLTGRMIDRSIRPLFNQDARKDVQVVLTVLSVDKENDYDIVALIAASAALSISGVEWKGSIGGIRVGLVDNKFIFNPTYEEMENSDLDLIVAGNNKKVIMIEAGAKEIKEEIMAKAILKGQQEMQPAIKLIEELKSKITLKPKQKKQALKDEDEIKAEQKKEKVFATAKIWLEENVKKYLFTKEYYTKGERKAAINDIKKDLDKFLFTEKIERGLREQAINKLIEKQVDTEITNALINDEKRVDGRKLDEIRNLNADVKILPRIHGSGLFLRGETQVMSIVTLGSAGLEQTLEGMEGEFKKRYIHHYNFPAFSVGEARPNRGASRRDIGHGALAEKALIPVIPKKEDFPYTIRVVSETLGSNGSSSMASTCASTLSLMDAGVPIKKHVAGIAMGLASNEDMSKWKILTDIQDLEDGQGGMDFKITGTKDGLTAIQLDTKTNGLNEEIIKKTFTQGRQALNQILKVLSKVIPESRPDLSKYAPRITSFTIDPDKIREVIGSGGKIINEIIDTCDVQIDIEDDGLVMVCGTNSEGSKKAVKWIKDIVRDFEPGEKFIGKVVRMLDFGIFVELMPGRDGMVHVSELAPYRVEKPENFLNIGDKVTVKIKEIDEKGRVNLTMKGLAENAPLWQDEKGKSEFGPQNNFRPRTNGNGPNRKPDFSNRNRNRF